jgi:hypothetical protein
MADFDNTTFTEKSLELYAETLRRRLPRVKFMLVDDENETSITRPMRRLTEDDTPLLVSFSPDDHMRSDGSIDQDALAQAVADGLSEPVILAAENDLKPEEDDPLTSIGAGQLWLLHKVIPVPLTLGAAHVHFANDGKIGLFGQRWFDNRVLETKFTVKTVWALARSNEIKKENLDIDALRQK